MSRGRKALSPAEKIGPELGRLTHEDAADEAAGKALDIAALEQSSILISAGRMQTYQFMEKVSRVGLLKEFQQVRESKEYKGLPYRDKDGKVRRVGLLDEFCEVFLGRTYNSLLEDAQNLNLLGDEMYEHALALGLTTRNFREIRSLTQDDQALVKEAIAAKNRETIIEILEAAISNHAKEKRTLEKEIKSAQGDLDAQRNVTAKKNQKLDQMEALLHRRQADLPAQMQELHVKCVEHVTSIINAVRGFTKVRLDVPELPGFAEHKDEIRGAIGVTVMQLLYQAQAWLSEEMRLAEVTFGGSIVEARLGERGPDWDEGEILAMKNAGAAEATRVAGHVVVEALARKKQDQE